MSSQFRPTRPEDAPRISQFMQLAFSMPPEHPGLELRQMHWKYWSEHAKWDGARGYVMERDDRIVAHGSVVPLTCVWGERRLKMLDLIDWAAHPANPGAGITLLKRVSQMVEGVFIAGGTEAAQKVFKSLGFRESAPATRFALPLRPAKRFITDREPWWKRPARLARNAMWTMRGLSAVPQGWSAHRLSPEELAESPLPMPRLRAQAAIFERTRADIAFLLNCPATPSVCYLVRKSDAARGYFVLNFAVNQARIGEAWVEPGEAGDWRALYLLAAAKARQHPLITEIVTVATNDAPARDGLRLSGFRPRGTTPLRFLIRGGDGHPDDVRYQLVDNDSAYMNHGYESHWT